LTLPSVVTLKLIQFLFEAPSYFQKVMLYFNHDHGHQCLYTKYKLAPQYFSDNMNICEHRKNNSSRHQKTDYSAPITYYPFFILFMLIKILKC